MNWVEEFATRKRLIEEQSISVWAEFVNHIEDVVSSYRQHFSVGNPKTVSSERVDQRSYVVESSEDVGAEHATKVVRLEFILN